MLCRSGPLAPDFGCADGVHSLTASAGAIDRRVPAPLKCRAAVSTDGRVRIRNPHRVFRGRVNYDLLIKVSTQTSSGDTQRYFRMHATGSRSEATPKSPPIDNGCTGISYLRRIVAERDNFYVGNYWWITVDAITHRESDCIGSIYEAR
jgi:hypothetical protein